MADRICRRRGGRSDHLSASDVRAYCVSSTRHFSTAVKLESDQHPTQAK